jgi:CheY-like chemotaxis protein
VRGADHVRVLVADDDVDAGAILGLLFEFAGCDVRVVQSGYEAVALARDFRPDLVILDINMPGMDGFEAADMIRRQPCANEAVYVAHTALNADAIAGRMKTSSFDEYLQKPAEFARFEAIIASTRRGRPALQVQ